MIVLNPAKPQTRQTATLIEELSHHLLRHEPSSIALNPETGFLERSYNRSQKDEAYDLGRRSSCRRSAFNRTLLPSARPSRSRLITAAVTTSSRIGTRADATGSVTRANWPKDDERVVVFKDQSAQAAGDRAGTAGARLVALWSP